MRVLITGGSGLIGKTLAGALVERGHEVVVLSRNPAQTQQQFRESGFTGVQIAGWDGRTVGDWGALLSRESAIVNLAGASPAHWHWTQAYRRRILESRLHAGEALMLAIVKYGAPAVFVQASAAGYYGDRGQELLSEQSAPGVGFRAEVCQAWEASTLQAKTRHCILRTGFVFDAHAGIFPSFLLVARLLGNRLGDGRQWMPWMHIEDVARAIVFLLVQPTLSGPFNLCAPELVTNLDFLRQARHVLRRPGLVSIPSFALKAALGELSTVVLDSQRLLPQRLMEANFSFGYPRLEQALPQLLGSA